MPEGKGGGSPGGGGGGSKSKAIAPRDTSISSSDCASQKSEFPCSSLPVQSIQHAAGWIHIANNIVNHLQPPATPPKKKPHSRPSPSTIWVRTRPIRTLICTARLDR
jgi:hypothetical protein